MRVVIVTDRILGSITARLRGHRMVEPLRALGVDATIIDIRDSLDEAVKRARQADCVYTLKVDNWDFFKALIEARIPYAFDLIDMLWSQTHQVSGFRHLNAIVKGASVVTCDNTEVMEWVSERTEAEVLYVPSAYYVEEFQAYRETHLERPRDIEVGWVGTPGTAAGVMKLQSVGLEVTCLGDDRSNYSEKELIEFLSRVKVGLYPVPINLADYRYRGPGKAILYMAAGAVPVMIAEGDATLLGYDSCSGVFVDMGAKVEDWRGCIQLAKENMELHQAHGWDYVKRHHSKAKVAGLLKDALEVCRG